MVSTASAYPYAKAIFALALHQNKIKEWRDLLDILAQVIGNKKYRHLWNAPKNMQHEIFTLLTDLCHDTLEKLATEGKNFLQLLCKKKQLALIPHIFPLYKKLHEQHENLCHGNVITAFALGDPQKKSLTESLQKKFNSTVILHYNVDPKIIGGMIIQINNQIIDGSIAGKLNRFIVNTR